METSQPLIACVLIKHSELLIVLVMMDSCLPYAVECQVTDVTSVIQTKTAQISSVESMPGKLHLMKINKLEIAKGLGSRPSTFLGKMVFVVKYYA